MVVVVLLVAAAAAVPLVISPDVIKGRIVDQIAFWTGRKFTFRGEPHLSLFPYLTVRLNGAKLANAPGMGDEPFMDIDTMTAKLEILPLFLGRLEFARFRLANPHINLKTDAKGVGNWIMADGVIGSQMSKGDKEGVSDDLEPRSPLADVRLGRLAIRDGTITYTDERNGRKEELTGVTASFDWTTTSQMAAGDGSFVWRGEPVEFNGSVDAPLDLLAGGSSSLRLAFSAAPLRLSFLGNALQLDGTQLEGNVKLTTPSVRRVVEWMGRPGGTGATFGAGAIDGKVNWLGSSVAISDATFELDGNAAEGALTANVGDGPFAVSGTLAFESLDLSPYIEAAYAASTKSGPWQSAPASLPLDNGDVDLRLSTSRLIAGGLDIGRTGATVTLKNGQLVVNVGEAELGEGTADGRLALAMDGGALTATGQLRLQDMSVASLLGEAGLGAVLDGVGNATIDASTRGATLGDLLENLAGKATVAIADGTLDSIDLSLLPEAVKDSGDGSMAGSTAFASLDASLGFGEGVVTADDLEVVGDTFSLKMTGQAGMFDPTIAGRGSLTLVGAGDDGTDTDVPFMINGTWNDWQVLPDLGPPVDRDTVEPEPATPPEEPHDG
ncbi:MAG: AsmA family protein [Bauldia sp.]|nr:AsmA family protein [Bauldia sp.]